MKYHLLRIVGFATGFFGVQAIVDGRWSDLAVWIAILIINGILYKLLEKRE